VIGFSLVEQPTFSAESAGLSLLRRLLGEAAEASLASLPAEQLFELLLQEARQRPPLLLIDNYESVLQALDASADPDEAAGPIAGAGPTPPDEATGTEREQAERLHRLLYRLAEAGLPLLITSRRQPSGFPGEALYPPAEAGAALSGLAPQAGADLFLHHSSRAKAAEAASRELARAVAEKTGGHPLAITLLAGEFDHSPEKNPATFLATWDEELAAARRDGLAAHHVTFATAFERSFRALDPAQQAHLAALAALAAPFFAEGAALLWGQPLPQTEAERAALHQALGHLAQRSLLAVDRTFTDGTPATYYLEPVILRHLRRHYPHPAELSDVVAAYAAYAAWLVNRSYGDIYSDAALAQLARQWLDELLAQAAAQPPDVVARYCRQLAWLLRHYGRLDEAAPLLQRGEAAARQAGDEAMLSSLLFEQASFAVTRGDLDGALGLYDESLAIQAKLGDLQGKSATLHAKA
jgi:hypothetical protein